MRIEAAHRAAEIDTVVVVDQRGEEKARAQPDDAERQKPPSCVAAQIIEVAEVRRKVFLAEISAMRSRRSYIQSPPIFYI